MTLKWGLMSGSWRFTKPYGVTVILTFLTRKFRCYNTSLVTICGPLCRYIIYLRQITKIQLMDLIKSEIYIREIKTIRLQCRYI